MPVIDFAIITALEKEAKAIVSRLENHSIKRFEDKDIRTYHEGAVSIQNTGQEYHVVVVTLPNMGNVSAANAVTDTIARWNPRFVLMVGIAGGIPQDDLDLGDVVVADQVVGYEYGKVTNQGLNPRDRVYPASALLLDRVNNFWDDKWTRQVNIIRPANAKRPISKRFIGPIASGNKVISSTEFRNHLTTHWPKLLALEMESEGVFLAVFDRPQIAGTLVVRGISDMADERKSDEWQEYAANAAAAFVIDFLASGPIGASPVSIDDDESLRSSRTVTTQANSQNMISAPQRLPSDQLPNNLYRNFVGRDALIDEIMAALRDSSGKWIIAIDGMGGIGKTALVREVADRCQKGHLVDVLVWESAPKTLSAPMFQDSSSLNFDTVLDSIGRQLGAFDVPKLRPAEKEIRIKALLQDQRVLIVLDNLETASEPQDDIVRRLLALLNPGKALLTSRLRFKGNVFGVHLTGLTEEDSIRFIRQEAQEKNIDRIGVANLSELRQVAQSAGGSPLALKLIVGQLDHLPLEAVLSQLQKLRLPERDSDEDDYTRFYKGIFWPSWGLLSNDSQKLLISMAHFAAGLGGTLEAIQVTSDLVGDALTRSITALWRLSFLEVGESSRLKQIRYYLHALTQYFVLSDIVQVL